MKRTMLAALLVVFAASWCLAQTDSLPAAAPEPCQPAACPMTCQPSVCAEPFVPKWAVGLRVYRLVDLPGSIYLERLYRKSSLEYYLSTNISSDISSQDGYLERRYDNDRLNLGVTYRRQISNDKRYLKLYLGFGPTLYYGRSYNRYSYYYVNSDISYGIDFSVFMQIGIAKDMVIKNIRLRNEIRFTPASVYVELGKRKIYYSERDTTIESIDGAYGVTAISTGSVSYSIKYLF